MDQKALLKRMLDFNKTTFDNTFSAMVTLQDQVEKMGNTLLEHATWLPEEGREAIENWIDAFKKGRQNFKKTVDESYEKVEAYFSG